MSSKEYEEHGYLQNLGLLMTLCIMYIANNKSHGMEISMGRKCHGPL